MGRKSYQEKHAHYLQLVQERNRVRKHIEEQHNLQKGPVAKREQGFTTCFSGANAKEKNATRGTFGAPKPLPKVSRESRAKEVESNGKSIQLSSKVQMVRYML